jgi:Arc/MetJ-type ribon-helix-helix transcriptional regulator
MAARKVAVTLEEVTVREVDCWVREGRYPSRSRAVQAALDALLERRRRIRLVEEARKLDPDEERALAEEGLGAEAWPEY